jgi:hypothetical protein
MRSQSVKGNTNVCDAYLFDESEEGVPYLLRMDFFQCSDTKHVEQELWVDLASKPEEDLLTILQQIRAE